MLRSQYVILAIGISLLACGTVRAAAWPEMNFPAGARVESIGDEIVFNGRSVRISRIGFSGTEQDVIEFFRRRFSSMNVVESRLKGDRLIAVREADYFVTVALHATSTTDVQATVMSTHMAGKRLGSEVASETRQMLPSESRVVSTLQSDDGGKHSLMLTAMNLDSVSANRDYIAGALIRRGFALTQESTLSAGRNAVLSQEWASPSEEAQVKISDAGKYRSVIINRVRESR